MKAIKKKNSHYHNSCSGLSIFTQNLARKRVDLGIKASDNEDVAQEGNSAW